MGVQHEKPRQGHFQTTAPPLVLQPTPQPAVKPGDVTHWGRSGQRNHRRKEPEKRSRSVPSSTRAQARRFLRIQGPTRQVPDLPGRRSQHWDLHEDPLGHSQDFPTNARKNARKVQSVFCLGRAAKEFSRPFAHVGNGAVGRKPRGIMNLVASVRPKTHRRTARWVKCRANCGREG